MSRRNRKNRNDSIKPPKPDEEEVLRDALYNQGFDVEKMMGSSGTFEMPNQIPNSYEADTSQGGEQHGSGSGMMGGGQEDDEVMKQMKRLGVGPAATMTLEERGITQEDLASVGNIQGLGGMPMGASDMVGSRGQQEESDMTAMMKGLEDLSEKDKEAALLAMGGPELLQQYYQQEAESRGGRGEMFGSSGQTGGGGQGRVPGAGGMLSSGRSNRGRGRMMGGRGRGRGNPGFPGMGGGGIPNMNGGGIPNMNGGGIPNMNGGGMPNMSGGGFPNMGGGGFPGTSGSEGTGEDQENMMQMLQQFQMIEALPKNEKEEALLSMGGQEFLDMYNEKIAPLMQMTGGGGAGGLAGLLGGQGGGGAGGLAGLLGGQGGGGAGGLAGLLGGQGGGGAGGLAGLLGGQGGGGAGGLAGLLGGQGGGGAGGLAGLLGGQGGGGAGGLAGLLGGQGGGAGGLAGLLGGQGGGGAGGLAGLLGGQGGGGAGGLAGLLGGQGGGGVPGLGGTGAGSGGLFGTGGRSGGDRNRKRQFDTKTFEGLKDLSDEDKQAAFNAMGLSEEDKIAALESLKHPDQTGQPGMQSETSEHRQKRRYWPPDHPYEPKGPGMYQFHRRQPLQLPIHSAGAESRRSLTGLMPLRRRKRRFGEKDLVRTHGSTIDVEGYFRHLVQTWTKSAEECKDPMCEGPSTIILLDVSESMRGEPIKEAVEGIQLYLDGLEYNKTEYGLEENIGLLVFHGDTFEVTHLTNDYSKIQNAMDNLKEVIGASPLIMPLAVVWGMATRAKPVEVKGHRILAKVVIFTDACITPPGYDPTQEEFVRQRVQDSVDANFFEVTGDMIHDQKIRLWSVPSGEKARDMREWFCNRIAHDGFGEKIFPNECRFLSRNYICEKIVAECSAQLPPLDRDNPDAEYDEDRVKDIAKSMFEDVDEDDIDFVMNRLKEKLQRPPLSKRQRREKRLQDERDRAEAIERGENPPPLPDDPDKKKRTKKGRKSLEELLGIDSSDDEEDNEESDLLFRLPGLLGDEEDAENDPLTKHKIQELLEYYGGGPPKTDNLPIMPNIGTRVKIGPDWMWQKNEIPDGTHGTIIGVDYEDVGWVRVRWDPPKGSSEQGKEEDYRYGLDYDFDVEPVDGGMDAVKWQAGKERKIVEPIWLQELNREKEELADLRRKIEEEKVKEKKRAECRETRLEREAQENQEQMRADEKARQIEDDRAAEKTRKIEGKTETMTTQTAEDSSWSDLSSETSERSERSNGGQVCYVWQYRDNDGTWRTFETDIQLKLEQTYVKRSGKGTVVIQFKGHNERVVFEKMEQRRIDKHSKRPVRRIEADADRLKELQDMFSS